MKNRSSPSTPPVNVRIDGDLFATLKERAQEEGLSTWALVDRLLRHGLFGSSYDAAHLYQRLLQVKMENPDRYEHLMNLGRPG